MLKEKSQSRYILHMREGPLIQTIVTEFFTFVEVTIIMNHANFVGYMGMGLVSAKGQI